MKDITPSGILKFYRENTPIHDKKQIEQFNAMSPSDRMELLFYMCFNTNASVQYLHSIVQPNAVRQEGVVEPAKALND